MGTKNSEHIDAAVKTAKNAEALLAEAHLLANFGRWARCYALAHLAREEVAKAQMIRELADDADLEAAVCNMKDHLSKLEKSAQVTVSCDPLNSESQAIVEGARHTKRLFNDLKNRSLYADFYEGGFWMPSEYMTPEFVEPTLKITEFAVRTIQDQIDGDLVQLRQVQPL
jgi:AbiV family abortive infection protein